MTCNTCLCIAAACFVLTGSSFPGSNGSTTTDGVSHFYSPSMSPGSDTGEPPTGSRQCSTRWIYSFIRSQGSQTKSPLVRNPLLSKDLKPTPSADPFMGHGLGYRRGSFLRSKVSGGAQDIFDRLLDDLVAAADIPKPLLFGTSPAGGLSESGKYEDECGRRRSGCQNQSLRRVLTQYFTIIMSMAKAPRMVSCQMTGPFTSRRTSPPLTLIEPTFVSR